MPPLNYSPLAISWHTSPAGDGSRTRRRRALSDAAKAGEPAYPLGPRFAGPRQGLAKGVSPPSIPWRPALRRSSRAAGFALLPSCRRALMANRRPVIGTASQHRRSIPRPGPNADADRGPFRASDRCTRASPCRGWSAAQTQRDQVVAVADQVVVQTRLLAQPHLARGQQPNSTAREVSNRWTGR